MGTLEAHGKTISEEFCAFRAQQKVFFSDGFCIYLVEGKWRFLLEMLLPAINLHKPHQSANV
jgi:hypothetical protein